jgi:putative ABC transport system substrate-binding protein
MGTDATLEVAAGNPTSSCLFTMILDPLSLGIASSMNDPGGNFTGAVIQVSPGKQLDALQQVDPRIKRIGVVYTSGDPTSTAFLAAAAVDAKKLNIEIDATPVAAGSSTHQALLDLSKQVDAFWLIVDPASVGPQSLSDTFEIAKANHMPVLGTSSANVREGALVALSANLRDLGDIDAEMAVPILNRAASPATTTIQGPRQTILSINRSGSPFHLPFYSSPTR